MRPLKMGPIRCRATYRYGTAVLRCVKSRRSADLTINLISALLISPFPHHPSCRLCPLCGLRITFPFFNVTLWIHYLEGEFIIKYLKCSLCRQSTDSNSLHSVWTKWRIFIEIGTRIMPTRAHIPLLSTRMTTVTMRTAGVKATLDTGVRSSEEIRSFPTGNLATSEIYN